MSRAPQQPYATPARPAFAPLQSSPSSHATSYSSTSSLASRSSTASAPMPSPSSIPQQQQQFFGSLNQQTQPSHQQQRMQAPQRHPSFEYQPNRTGAGQTAAETTNYLNQAALLAEAAKRAQMACVMRDIGDMEL
ncbi:Nn.00g002690.m01.CDS01 [Neocucurbitaria sp. VM-36]